MNYKPATLARTPGSPIVHYLNRGAATHRTMCGKDATGMHRWDPTWPSVDRRTFRPCAKCGA